ncbi:unnamed protein product [Calicophoron daubneyi]|uniref:Exocyst complex component n=1 Tax=Calicophoron daubneyi TaxID=300641 RepID=A0AAV2TES1_CALDB
MAKPDPGPLDFNLLLGEIESGSSGSVANVIRKLREHEVAAYQAGVGGPTGELMASFISTLDARAQERNTEIEKTCAHHYESFVNATRELLTIQQDAGIMQNEMQTLNSNLDSAIHRFTESCNELSNCKVTLEHVDRCIEALQIALPILDQYSRIEQSIAAGRFYHALKTLEDLEHAQLDRIRPYAFSEIVIRRIPKMRSEIKNASLGELTDFLEQIRKHSIRLGTVAMREVAQATGMDSEALMGPNSTSGDTKVSKLSAPTNLSSQQSITTCASSDSRSGDLENELDELIQVASGRDEQDVENTGLPPKSPREWRQACIRTEDLVDFGPVYRCLHIHSVVNERADFERHYCAQRRKQCQLTLSLSQNQQANMRNYGEFFGSICGFFVVDDYLRHTLPGSSASYQTYLDELWGNTVERLVEFARTNAGACDSAKDLIRLKDYSILFGRTMQSLGFPIGGLSEMITWIQRRYQRLLANQMRDKFEKIICEDTFSEIKINNKAQLSKLLDLYPPCNTAEFADLPLPRQLCYSWMVPRIYECVREYIDLCCQFCAHVDLAYSELEDTVNRATNALFTDCLNIVLTSHVRQSERILPRLVCFCINLEELETACGYLDAYLQQLMPSHDVDNVDEIQTRSAHSAAGKRKSGDSQISIPPPLSTGANPPRSRLQGASLLKDIRALVESLIYAHMNDCVDQFLSLVDYNNTGDSLDGINSSPMNEKTAAVKPNEHIVDLISWLTSTFQAFANVPPKVAQTACLSVCKYIARSLHDFLLGPKVHDLTDQNILQLSTDLGQCEAFARSQPVPGLDSNMLSLIFADLRQLLDLYRRDDWVIYISSRNGTENNPYDRVSPSFAIKLLERIRDTEKKRTGFLHSMRKEERGRRKKIDDIIRQLRELVAVSQR